MHAFFLTRGIKKDVDEMVKFLETRAFPLPVKMQDGKDITVPIQGNLQPVQLWSYVFPQDCKDTVLKALKFDKAHAQRWVQSPKQKALMSLMRKALGAKKTPKFDEEAHELFMPKPAMQNIAIMPIGVSYDDLNYEDPNGTVHEAI